MRSARRASCRPWRVTVDVAPARRRDVLRAGDADADQAVAIRVALTQHQQARAGDAVAVERGAAADEVQAIRRRAAGGPRGPRS